MTTYIVTLFLTTSFGYIASFFSRKKNKLLCLVFLLLATALPVMVAAVRSLSVGRDINVYLTRLMNECDSSHNIISYVIHSGTDPLFAAVVYIGYISRSPEILLGFIQLVTILPIVLLAYNAREKYNIGLVLFVYMATIYCPSLNIMRQSMAITLSIYASYLMINDKCKRSLALFILAALSHSTAAICLFIVVYWKIARIKSGKKRCFYAMVSIAAIVLGASLLDKIVANTSYYYHLDLNAGLLDFSILSVLKRAIWILPIALSRKRNDIRMFNLFLIITSVVLSVMSFRLSGAGRLSLYFLDLAYLSMLPIISSIIGNKKVLYWFYAIVLFVFWIHATAVNNDSSRVYPYKSEIMKINEVRHE